MGALPKKNPLCIILDLRDLMDETDCTLVDLRLWEIMIDYMEDTKDFESWIVHTKRDLTAD